MIAFRFRPAMVLAAAMSAAIALTTVWPRSGPGGAHAAVAEALPVPVLHHIGLNVIDPERSQKFYKSIWPKGEIVTYAGVPSFKTEIYLMFHKVARPAPGKWDPAKHRSTPQSPFWHIGMNIDSTPPKERWEKEKLGMTVFEVYENATNTKPVWRAGEAQYPSFLTAAQQAATPAPGPRPGGFMYFLGPDGEIIEATGGPGTKESFQHFHLYRELPWCASNWYIKHLGMKQFSRRDAATGAVTVVPIPEPCNVPVGPPSWPSLEQQGTLRNPRGEVTYANGEMPSYSRQCQRRRCAEGDTPLVSSKGQVLEHIGFLYPDLAKHVERLRGEGVTIIQEVHPFSDTRAAMISDLDGLLIELVERLEPSKTTP